MNPRQRHSCVHRDGARLHAVVVACGLAILAGCQAPAARRPGPDYPVFPPLRHGVKAVFGPNGNDLNGDLAGQGQRFADAFHDLQLDLTRIEFKWAAAEPQRGTYDWSELDRLIGFLHQQSIEPMLMLYCAPTWAMRGTPADEQLFIDRGEQNLHTVVWPRRDCLPDFERFCETAARRYRGMARLFEFWNEPDGMAGPTVYHDRTGKAVDVRYGGDAKEYTFWLKRMHAAVKRGNPDAVVAAGSLCVHDTRFMEAIYAAGCRDCCDAISLHPYGKDGINVEWVRQCRQVMNAYDDWSKPVWLSEFGWALGGEYDKKNECWPPSATRQAEIITATAPVIQSLPYITHAFWFTLNDWNTSQTGIDPVGTHRFGIMDLSGRRRPAFEALHNVVLKTCRESRRAEMPLPAVVPPAHPVDVGADGRVTLTLTCCDPNPLFCDSQRTSRPAARPLVVDTPGLKLGRTRNLDVHFSAGGHGRAESLVVWTALATKVRMDFTIDPSCHEAPAPNAYEAVASFGYGPQTHFPVTLPAVAGYMASAPKVDAEFSDWPARWSIGDGALRAEYAWTSTHLYLACIVRDPQHKQSFRDRDIWKGDCIQVAFDPPRDAIRGSQYDVNDSEYALALTQDGPLFWRFICPPDSYVGQVIEAQAAVKRVGDKTYYEAALPWSELGVTNPAAGQLIGTAIAACDWNREQRSVHRFGDGIIGHKEPYRFASIRLSGTSGAE